MSTYEREWDEPEPRIVTCLNCGRKFCEDDLCECHDPEEDLSSEVA